MIRFHQTFGAHTGRVCECPGDRFRFGRMPDSDMAFDANADLDASGRHGEARLEGGQWVFVDVGSRNGSYVNGERVERAVLRHGDEIEFGLGGPRVRVEIDGSGSAVVPGIDPGPSNSAEPAVNSEALQVAGPTPPMAQPNGPVLPGAPEPNQIVPPPTRRPASPGLKIAVVILSLLLTFCVMVIAVLAWFAFGRYW